MSYEGRVVLRCEVANKNDMSGGTEAACGRQLSCWYQMSGKGKEAEK